ncbi:MAG: hypothetical protein CMC15_14730 [Flavobacteriaceae bacterium]|nr:hypothetical protein [Flavobacteriaceae bacterium]
MKIRIEYKLSSDRESRRKEVSAIESTIAACHPDLIVWEVWELMPCERRTACNVIMIELREKKQ